MEGGKKMLARFTPGDVDYVVERELALASNYASHSDPSAVLLAGQSGAGNDPVRNAEPDIWRGRILHQCG